MTTSAARVIGIGILLAAAAAAQDTRSLTADLERLVAVAKNPAPIARTAGLDLLAPLTEKIAKEYPELSALERQVGGGRDYEARVAMQAALGSVCERLGDELGEALASGAKGQRQSALSIIRAAGPRGRPMLPAMLKAALASDDEGALDIGIAAEAIGGVEESFVPGLRDAIGGPDPASRKRAIVAAVGLSFGDDKAAVAPLAHVLGGALSDPEEDIREKAVDILVEIGAHAAAAKDALEAAITREPTSVLLAYALHEVDPRNPAAVPGLIARIDRDGKAANEAIEGLREIGPGAAAALPVLVPRATPDYEGSFAVRAIAAIDQDGAVAVPVLIEAAAKNEEAKGFAIDELVRRSATSIAARAWLEGRLASVEGAAAILERLRRAPADPSATFQVYEALFAAEPSPTSFLRALARTGPDCRQGLPLLIKALASPDLETRATAVERVRLFGTDGAAALPWLRQLLGDVRPGVRSDVVRAMTQVDPTGRLTLDDLIFRLADEDPSVRIVALESIARLGPKAARAAPAISFRLAETTDESERVWARRALARVSGDSRALVAEIVARLLTSTSLPGLRSDSDLHQRDLTMLEPLPSVDALAATLAKEGETGEAVHALLLLASHGARALPALPWIAVRLKSSEPNVRIAAANAIREIGPAARSAVPALCTAFEEATKGIEPGDSWGDAIGAPLAALAAIGPAAKAALPRIARAGEPYLDQVIRSIDPPDLPRLAVAVEPSLRVCGGRWLGVGQQGRGVRPVRAWVERDAVGRRIQLIAEHVGEPSMCGFPENPSITLYLRRAADGSVEVRGSSNWMSLCKPGPTTRGSDPIRGGTITFRSLDFGSGAPVQAVLRFAEEGHQVEVAFTCEDPFKKD